MIWSKFNGTGIGMHNLNVSLSRNVIPAHCPLIDLPGIRSNINHIAFMNINDTFRHTTNGHSIGSNEVLAISKTDNHRRSLTSSNYAIRLIIGNYSNCIATLNELDS